MKLELKENMYIRTCDGIIDKVIIDYNGHCANPNCECKHISCEKNYYDEDKVIKASFDIIDLIEVGDYVNGSWVNDIVDGKPIHEDCNDPFYSFWWENEDIKTVITHEQMERMAYKVGE